MRRWVFLFAVVCATPLLGAAALPVATGSQTVVADIALHRSVFVSCANGGAGDVVTLDGRLHTLFTTVADAAGGTVVVHESFNPMGVSGEGSGGYVYRGTGHTSSIDVETQSRAEVTVVNDFMVIRPGPGNDLAVRTLLHFGIGPDGVVNPFVDDVSISCG